MPSKDKNKCSIKSKFEENIYNLRNNDNKKIDFSKYEIIEKNKEQNLIIYKCSNLERISNHKLVYQYFYDKFDDNDYKNAYIVLFCGAMGVGKCTAINALFNIIKGIELEDAYRFILNYEPNKMKNQIASKNHGVHLYYLKDYNNQPIILININDFFNANDNIEYDIMVNESFNFIFSSLIDHINTICFLVNSHSNKLDIKTKYIFSSVACLFSKDINENCIILSTFANKDTMTKGPDFIESIKTDLDFLKIKDRMNDKW